MTGSRWMYVWIALAVVIAYRPTAATADGDEPVSAADLLAEEAAGAEEEPAEAGLPSFGVELEGLHTTVNVSAYGDVSFVMERDGAAGFDQGHANPIIGARIGNQFYAELELEFEHGGDEQFLEYAYVDWLPRRYFGVRAGKFLVPVGYFNENLHPSFRNKLVSRPLVNRQILPSTWSETGVQIKGDVDMGERAGLRYQMFVVNGLQEQPGKEGGSISDMRGNERDLEDRGKSVGGRLGGHRHFGANEVQGGVSGYYGRVSRDGDQDLTMLAGDAMATLGPVELLTEGAVAWLDRAAASTQVRFGLYAQAAWNVAESWDLIARYDLLDQPDLEGRTHQAVGGVRYVINQHLRLFLEGAGRWVDHHRGEPIGRTMLAFSF